MLCDLSFFFNKVITLTLKHRQFFIEINRDEKPARRKTIYICHNSDGNEVIKSFFDNQNVPYFPIFRILSAKNPHVRSILLVTVNSNHKLQIAILYK